MDAAVHGAASVSNSPRSRAMRPSLERVPLPHCGSEFVTFLRHHWLFPALLIAVWHDLLGCEVCRGFDGSRQSPVFCGRCAAEPGAARAAGSRSGFCSDSAPQTQILLQNAGFAAASRGLRGRTTSATKRRRRDGPDRSWRPAKAARRNSACRDRGRGRALPARSASGGV